MKLQIINRTIVENTRLRSASRKVRRGVNTNPTTQNGTLAIKRGFSDSDTPSAFASFATQQAAQRPSNGYMPLRHPEGQILAISEAEKWALWHTLRFSLAQMIHSRHCFSKQLGSVPPCPRLARELRERIKTTISLYRRISK